MPGERFLAVLKESALLGVEVAAIAYHDEACVGAGWIAAEFERIRSQTAPDLDVKMAVFLLEGFLTATSSDMKIFGKKDLTACLSRV